MRRKQLTTNKGKSREIGFSALLFRTEDFRFSLLFLIINWQNEEQTDEKQDGGRFKRGYQ
jgi:hypothetical protein